MGESSFHVNCSNFRGDIWGGSALFWSTLPSRAGAGACMDPHKTWVRLSPVLVTYTFQAHGVKDKVHLSSTLSQRSERHVLLHLFRELIVYGQSGYCGSAYIIVNCFIIAEPQSKAELLNWKLLPNWLCGDNLEVEGVLLMLQKATFFCFYSFSDSAVLYIKSS